MQPDLSKYYGNLKTSHSYFLEAEIVLIWKKIGTGSFARLTPSVFELQASYDVLGLEGTVNLSVEVTGTNVGQLRYDNQHGPCSFQEDGDTLNILFNGKTYKLSWAKSGVQIGGDIPKVTALWIGE
jgi:hypothetical protein